MPKIGKTTNGRVLNTEERLYDALLAVLYRATAREGVRCCDSLRLGQSLMREEVGMRTEALLSLVKEYLDATPDQSILDRYAGLVKSDPTLDDDIPF